MNKQRKHKLHQRADQYAVHASGTDGRTYWGLAYNGYLDGYKAAMRDMRRAINFPLDEDRDTVRRIREFLRPIR